MVVRLLRRSMVPSSRHPFGRRPFCFLITLSVSFVVGRRSWPPSPRHLDGNKNPPAAGRGRCLRLLGGGSSSFRHHPPRAIAGHTPPPKQRRKAPRVGRCWRSPLPSPCTSRSDSNQGRRAFAAPNVSSLRVRRRKVNASRSTHKGLRF